MMTSSRDRTSTVRKMWWVGNVTSSKEEAEAQPMGQGAPLTKKQEDREAKVIGMLHMLEMLEPVKIKNSHPAFWLHQFND